MLKIAVAALSLALLTATGFAQEAPAGIKRTPLQKLAYPDGYTVMMGTAEIPPGGASGRHTHPGVETGYILEGEVLMSVEGQPDQTLNTGDSYQIPAAAAHDVKTVGDKPAKALATYVVEADKPLASPAP
ncbi:cupin domain-containing protein [Mesorhizobium sp. LHD-90]|uniref:cupin domain-containing protein n=1 Tax=Mesorhizobium sp. LHD-90 TaxID=3071414 RepID=UPI0027E0E32A|nr:cupin domain-containing protein [Mesorhizobium sp. LHD-90]MDQ6436097.1 cupin domain-containing protein [Mesorhizobium sp. LHD-90]